MATQWTAGSKSASNGPVVNDTSKIPTGTAPKSESYFLDRLKACNARNFETLADVALSGIKGEPLDDKTYLMERIIQLTAELPLHDKFSDTLTAKFLGSLWNDLSHPPSSYLGYDFLFRKADGSNNNIMWPQIGKAGQPYARSVRPKKMQPPRPDPEVIYESVLKREKFRPHPNKISSVLFYVASIIIHDCFHTSHADYSISETSSYLDLAPLYGSNQKEQEAMRTFKDGKLRPDCFSDNRIFGFPPGVGVLLIMFNRFHNHVVENLAKIDEGRKFSSILNPNIQRRTGLMATDEVGKPKRTPEQLYDEALFQTGRLITCGLYINIVLGDYVRTILGLNRVDSSWSLDPRASFNKTLFTDKIPEAGGNQVSAEFSLVYRWHSCVSQRDDKWTGEFLHKIVEKDPEQKHDFNRGAAKWVDDLLKVTPDQRPFEDLKRQSDGRFSDDDLCQIWTDSVDDVAGAFGAAHVPLNLKFVEVLSMNQARSWNLASLNEFREYFSLAPHTTFESINPDPHIAGQLEKLYGHPDNVELYPGIVVESAKESMSPGSGLCASWTTSRAILADAVALVRGDRFYTVDYTPSNLTNWGFQAASSDLDIDHGGVFYKLVLNAFPNHVAKNSVYAHFPLVNPPENEVLLKKMHRDQLYSFVKPGFRPVVSVEASTSLGSKALTDSSAFASLWDKRSAAYGVPEAAKAKPTAKMSFAEAVMANDKWKAVTTKFYETTLAKLWKEQQYALGGYQQVDVVADVLNKAHVSFITSVLGIPMSTEKDAQKHDSILSTLGRIFESAFDVNAQPKGLDSSIRDFTHHIADAVGSLFGDSGAEGELGKAAFAKLEATEGHESAKLIWNDVLPTSALILTTLSRSTAAVAEQTAKDSSSAPKYDMSIAVRATAPVDDAKKGQVVVVDLSTIKHDDDIKKLGPEVLLAKQAADIAGKVISDMMKPLKELGPAPGGQGIIKKIQFDEGDVKYLNAVESDYVAYPVSMKVRWK